MIPDIVKVVRYFITNFKGRMGADEENCAIYVGDRTAKDFSGSK